MEMKHKWICLSPNMKTPNVRNNSITVGHRSKFLTFHETSQKFFMCLNNKILNWKNKFVNKWDMNVKGALIRVERAGTYFIRITEQIGKVEQFWNQFLPKKIQT